LYNLLLITEPVCVSIRKLKIFIVDVMFVFVIKTK